MWILKIILFGSLLGMGIIFLRNYPKMVLTSPEALISKRKERFSRLRLKFHYFFTHFGEKLFHQFRIFVLKIENKINSLLEEFKKRKRFLRKNEKTQRDQKLS